MKYTEIPALQSVRFTDEERAIIAAIHDAHPHLTRGTRGQNVSGAVSEALHSWADAQGVTTMAERGPSQFERAARERGEWLVVDSARNPRNNQEFWFETLRDAREHVRERQWHQAIYGPQGEFHMWDGYRWK